MARNIVLYKRRRKWFLATFKVADGTNLNVTGGDNLRMKIGVSGHAPILDIDTRNPTPNGSSMTLANPSEVTIDGDDIGDNFRPGVYSVEFTHVDDAHNSEALIADVQVAIVHETMEGSLSIDEESSSSTLSSSSSSSSSTSSSSS